MVQIKNILFFQWKTYFRSISIKRKTHRRFFFIIFLYLPFLIFPFIQFLTETKTEIINKNYENCKILFFGLLFYWILLSSMAKELYLNLSVKRLNRFPISNIKLFIIRSLGTFIQPISWLGILGLFSLIYLSIFTKYPFFYSLISVLFTLILFQIMLFISFISKIAGKFILIAMIPLLYFISTEPVFYLPFFQKLLRDSFSKLSIILSLDTYIFLLILSLLLIILITINYFVFINTSFKNEPIKGKKTRPVTIKIPGNLSGIILKDIFYFFKNRNFYLVLFITLLYFKYIFLDNNPSEYSFFVLMFFLFIPSTTFILNVFGFDTAEGINRYTIFPLKGYQILLAKNISYTIFVIIQLLPIIVVSFWKFGFNVFLFGCVQMFLMILLQTSIGNHVSILNPEKFVFSRFNFGSLHLGFPSAFLYFITYLEEIRSIQVFRNSEGNGIVKQLLFLLIYLIIYIFSLKYNGKKLENNMDYIKESLK